MASVKKDSTYGASKNGCTVASKMKAFIQLGLLELTDELGSLPECTYFSHSHPNMIEDFLYELQHDFPELLSEKNVFLKNMSEAYDTFSRLQWAPRLSSSLVSSGGGETDCKASGSGIGSQATDSDGDDSLSTLPSSGQYAFESEPKTKAKRQCRRLHHKSQRKETKT